jgi:hypothetical protein
LSKEFYIGLAVGFLGILMAVMQMMYPVIPQVVGWPIVGTLAIATFICLDIGIRKREQQRNDISQATNFPEHSQTSSNIESQQGSMDTVSSEDRRFIVSLCMDMIIQHGHMDLNGLLADRASGTSLNQLMAKECSVCGIVRNIRSNRWERSQ